MTRAKRRYFVDTTTKNGKNVPEILHRFIEELEKSRTSTMPRSIDESTPLEAIYSYGDVLMFEIAMVIRGHSVKEAAEHMGVDRIKLSRILGKFDRGQSADKYNPPKKGNAFIIQQMIQYNDTSRDLLKYQFKEHQGELLRKRKGWL